MSHSKMSILSYIYMKFRKGQGVSSDAGSCRELTSSRGDPSSIPGCRNWVFTLPDSLPGVIIEYQVI